MATSTHSPVVPSKANLVRILRKRSYREGHFTLASGKSSTFYLDVKETALHPEGAFLIGALAVEAILSAGLRPYAVGGLTLGADPLSTAVSLAFFSVGMEVPAYIVRKQAKDHGTSSWLEGAKTFPKGAELVVLEDVTTTGGSSLKAVDKLLDAGFKVTAILTVVDRLEGARKAIEERGLKFISLCTLIDIRSAVS